jgi:hypothetical protein
MKFQCDFKRLRENRANIKGLEICLNRSHNPKVLGSNPSPATKLNKRVRSNAAGF